MSNGASTPGTTRLERLRETLRQWREDAGSETSREYCIGLLVAVESELSHVLAERPAETIDCPVCGETVSQVASATLSLALWQHWNWTCPKRLADLPTGTDWQPIETHDGSFAPVLVADPQGVFEAWYCLDEGGWWQVNTHPTDIHDGRLYPTHWRQMPAGPDEPRQYANGLRNLDTPENRAFWKHVDDAVAMWREQKPEWAKKLEETTAAPAKETP